MNLFGYNPDPTALRGPPFNYLSSIYMYRSQHKAVTFDCNFTLFIFIKTQCLLHATKYYATPFYFMRDCEIRRSTLEQKGHNKICHFSFKYKLTTDRKCADCQSNTRIGNWSTRISANSAPFCTSTTHSVTNFKFTLNLYLRMDFDNFSLYNLTI